VARVPESASEGTFVAHVVVSDPDEGRNGRFDCILTGDSSPAENSFQLMTVAEGEYQLLTAAMLDRELGDEYRLSVTCEDGGQPALVSSATLLVQVMHIITHQSPSAAAAAAAVRHLPVCTQPISIKYPYSRDDYEQQRVFETLIATRHTTTSATKQLSGQERKRTERKIWHICC